MQPMPGLSRPGLALLGLFRFSPPQVTAPRPDVADSDPVPEFTLGSSRNRTGKIAVIVALHLAGFWAMQNGMVRDVVKQLPQVVNVTFVATPEPETKPAPPKTVEVALQAPPVITPPIPQLPIVIENTITVPPSPPKPVEAAPAVVAAAPAPAALAPAPPARPSAPQLVSGVEYVRPPRPQYPTISRRLGETGVVTLRVLVSDKGTPEQATVQQSSGSANLDEAGRQAALRSLFKPYMEDGKAVPVYVLVPINFKLS
ncbi:protein TonB [Pseudoduganella lurida]|uniref:Protein TonB n=1 Tax=Pseudoduganella lurida TaxID=1036180 RepID=A0A562QXK8_9BURK|nr:energy transducer TonB [Pseudoduganella lurida]TWI61515.1 protein TonB [Pseudoduganella lurida]